MSESGLIAIIDDSPDEAKSTSWAIEALGHRTRIITQKFFSRVPDLVSEIGDQCLAVVCDHRLSHGRLADFYGAEVVSRLNQTRIPAVLATQFVGPDIDASIRLYRRRIPAVLGKDQLEDESVLERAITFTIRELQGEIHPLRRPHRTLVRIEDCTKEGDLDVADAFVPSWNPSVAVRFPLDLIAPALRKNLKPGDYLIARVNIGAEDPHDLFFEDFEAAPAESDSLG